MKQSLLSVAVLGLFASLSATAQNGGQTLSNGVYLSDPVVPFEINVDLRTLPAAPVWQPGDPVQVVPEGVAADGPTAQIANWEDPSAQTRGGTTPGEVLFAFEAHPNGNFSPPDTVGAVGPNHYISMVNASRFAIWDKQGNNLVPPTLLETLFTDGPSPCENGSGDPIVVYDTLADRWLMQEFVTGSNNLCIYISQGPDPVTDGWFVYEFTAPSFPDYPQYGVWPDAYYVSTFEFPSLGIYAFDRAAMLAGEPVAFQRLTVPALQGTSPRVTRILPADFDGQIPPPGATPPNPFVRAVHSTMDATDPTTRLELYEFALDLDNPANSTFTLAQTLIPQTYELLPCSPGVRDCIPQPGTGNLLDALFNRGLRQLHYRSFGDNTESMVINSVVDAGSGLAGVRWWELFRDNNTEGAGWTIRQDSTYAPDDTFRFMGSMAINGNGDIALAYSASSDTVFPAIRATARRADDPLNEMTMEEVTLVEGEGVFTANQRWGDYTSLDVDPANESVFWHVNQRVTASGQRSVWVGAYRFALGEEFFQDGFEDSPAP